MQVHSAFERYVLCGSATTITLSSPAGTSNEVLQVYFLNIAQEIFTFKETRMTRNKSGNPRCTKEKLALYPQQMWCNPVNTSQSNAVTLM